MLLIKQLWFGMFLNRHIRIRDRHKRFGAVANYHQERAAHYYKRIYGKEYDKQ